MQIDEKYLAIEKEKNAAQLRIAKILVWGFVAIAFILFTSVSGCVMYVNSVEADQTRAETEQIKERSKIEKEKVDAISGLINKGINPIAARCAIKGYTITIQMGAVHNPCTQFLNKDGKRGEELQ